MIESSSSRGSFFSFLSSLPLGLIRFPFSFLLFFIFYPPVLRMIVTVRRLGGVGDAMAGMVGSVFRMIVWLVGRLKSIGWWGGGGARSMGYAYSYTTRGLCRWKLVIRIELEDLGKLIVDASLEMLQPWNDYKFYQFKPSLAISTLGLVIPCLFLILHAKHLALTMAKESFSIYFRGLVYTDTPTKVEIKLRFAELVAMTTKKAPQRGVESYYRKGLGNQNPENTI